MYGAKPNSRQKKGCRGTLFDLLGVEPALCLLAAVALTELVDLFGGLQDVLLTGVKRMRLARNFKLQQRVFVSVFPLDGFARGYRRFGQNGEIGGNVLEDDVSIFGMYVWFHGVATVGRVAKGGGF